MEKTTDLALLVQKAPKDPDAFAQLYAQTVSFSYAVARSYLSNPQDIEDVLQTSYMYAAKSLPDLREPENFLSWMRTIVVHECQKCLKTNRKFSDLLQRSKEAAVEKEDLSDWSDILERHERYEAVRDIMDSLPNEQKMCTALFYYDGKTVAEIAELLNVPQGTVKSRLYHARRKLEKALKKLAGQDEAFVGVPPMLVLKSYFKHGEKEVASITLRKSVWASLFTKGAASGGAGALIPSGLSGAAVSAGVSVPTAVKAAAVVLTAVTAVGGGVTAVKHIQTQAAPAKEAVMTVTKANERTSGFVLDETSRTEPTSTTPALQAATTVLPAATTERGDETRSAKPSNAAAAGTTEPARQPTAAAQAAAQNTTKSSTAPPNATAAGTTEPARQPTATAQATTQNATKQNTTKQTTAPSKAAATTAAKTTQQSTAATTRASTTRQTTQAATAAAQYQMTGGVLRSYTGSESSITIPATIDGETVTAIGSGAFAQNGTVRSVQIPSGVTQLGQQAFSDCTSLQSVSLPSSLRSIGAGAFDGCTSLTNVTVPNGTQSIGDDAFSGCRSLRQITVPSSVTSIGDGAFDGCDGLTIRCAEGSAAHTYAKNHGISYQLTEGI